MKSLTRKIFIILIATLGGAFSFWAVRGDDAREFDRLVKNALCVLDLRAGESSISASFVTSRTINQFQVGTRSKGKHERLSFSISDSKGLICRVTTDDGNSRFGCGREIPPGTYEVTLRQETGSHGASVAIAGEIPVYITGWQIWSRIYLCALLLVGLWAYVARRGAIPQQRAMSAYLFQILVLGFLAIFIYLLFHEGGHSLAEIVFGCYDFARSDFWGIQGSPHSGGKSDPPLQPWQQALISGGGPMLPTFAGWFFFLLWSFSPSRKLRDSRPMVTMYSTATIAMLVFPWFVVTPAYLLGIINSDGDWNGFIGNIHGHLRLIQRFLWVTFLVNAVILWRIAPELLRAWKTKIQELRASGTHCPQA